MNLHQLDLTALEKVMTSLQEAVVEYGKQPTNNFIRDAAIQRFEYTYELTHKILKRYLEITEPSAEEIDQMPFQDLIRTGSERGLLRNGWDIWKNYRHARNMTSHTYSEKKAIEVYSIIPEFAEESKIFISNLKTRIVQAHK